MTYTYRQIFTKHLPEPYRSQAMINTTVRGLDIDRPFQDGTGLRDALLSAFVWEETPEGFAYWLAASEGELKPEARTLRLETGKRYLTRDGREALVTGEDFSYGPDSSYRFDGEVEGYDGFSWSATGRFEPIRENSLDLVEEIVEEAVDPGAGYRLLEEGETILKWDEEADAEEGGGWTTVRNPGDTYQAWIWFPVRRKTSVDPGAGYRLVEVGEYIETGDEWFEEDGRWEESCWKTGSCVPKAVKTPLRRKIAAAAAPAPPTYRLLNPDEIIREGDEWYFGRRGHEWVDWVGAHGTAVDAHTPPTRRQIKSYEDA